MHSESSSLGWSFFIPRLSQKTDLGTLAFRYIYFNLT